MDGESEAQRGELTCPRSPSEEVGNATLVCSVSYCCATSQNLKVGRIRMSSSFRAHGAGLEGALRRFIKGKA